MIFKDNVYKNISRVYCYNDEDDNLNMNDNIGSYLSKGKFYKLLNGEDNLFFCEEGEYMIINDDEYRHIFCLVELLEGNCKWFQLKESLLIEKSFIY